MCKGGFSSIAVKRSTTIQKRAFWVSGPPSITLLKSFTEDIPDDPKRLIFKEVKVLEEILTVVEQLKENVDINDKFCNRMKDFDTN